MSETKQQHTKGDFSIGDLRVAEVLATMETPEERANAILDVLIKKRDAEAERDALREKAAGYDDAMVALRDRRPDDCTGDLRADIEALLDAMEPEPEEEEQPQPIGNCPKCGVAWYADEGFCGGCKP